MFVLQSEQENPGGNDLFIQKIGLQGVPASPWTVHRNSWELIGSHSTRQENGYPSWRECGGGGVIQIRPGDEGEIIVVLPYAPERVARIKTVPGRRWHAEEKYWTVPRTDGMVERLLEPFAGEEVEVDPALRPVREVMEETLAAVENELKLRGYSPRTGKAYRGQVERFLKWIDRAAQEVTAEDVRTYLLHLAEERGVSASYRN